MKLTLNVFVILLTITSFSCKQEKQLPNNEVSKMWSQFLRDLEINDKVAFKKASGETIRCYDCLENTPSEMKKMSLLRENDALYYNKIYDNLIYIPIDSFIANDYDILFNPQFINILQENETIIVREVTEGKTYAHILVTTTLPTAFFEGGQHNFSFIKIKDGQWRLNEISTIP
ncbi:hypothetical protein [Maribacter ulvicola]|uniref:Uncharacterized protein n=1 Tax=Maribacter ulvicola TaxID=228959 RepID=A0A1N6WHN9_9FLAO|nr:hypothetical protein [Maribacter ulvicola]SIQ89574.1 hypothetical protein SAMN05421797_10488 [Maribacter ulvicola]